MFLALSRVVKIAFSNFRRTLWLSVATLIVMIMAVVVFYLVVTLRVVTSAALTELEHKIDVSVYLASSVSEDNAKKLAETLRNLPTVAEVSMVTRAQALASFRTLRGSDASIQRALAELQDNPFGVTLKIRAKNVADYPQIITTLEDPSVVPAGTIERKSFSEHQQLIERFSTVSARAQHAMQMLGIAFLLISFFVVLNTVRIAIYTHREEIRIMKLVGASNWFVRAPFLVEGVIYSVLATMLSMGVLFGVLFWGGPSITQFFAGIPLDLLGFYREHALIVFGSQFLVLTLINMLGAAIAIGRYLKV